MQCDLLLFAHLAICLKQDMVSGLGTLQPQADKKKSPFNDGCRSSAAHSQADMLAELADTMDTIREYQYVHFWHVLRPGRVRDAVRSQYVAAAHWQCCCTA
jgi:hypothetical protein